MKLRRILSCVMALLLICSLPVSAFADTWYLEDGDVTVSATESGQTVSQGETIKNDDAPVITQKDSTTSTTNTITIKAEENATANVTIQDVNIVISDPTDNPQDHSGQAAVTIDVAENAEANVTLDGVNIDVGGTGGDTGYSLVNGEAAVQITGNGDVTLELDGKNTVQGGYERAGVEKNTTAATKTEAANGTGNLTITDENGTDGSLKATGGYFGAGIGGGEDGIGSNITITGSAEVNATGGKYGAGIGGGAYGSGSNITITGSAEVNATGGDGGSGIGGGWNGSGSSITITGSAQVEANGGNSGTGIGGGTQGDGSNITITGSAEVTAQGGDCGAGIGGGNQGDGSNITISGSAQVGATGGRNGAGIGGGSGGSGSSITITGSAEVTAKGGDSGSGIGGGSNGNGNGTGSNITVSGDAQVKAQGGNQYTELGQNYRGAGAAIGNGGEHRYGAVPNPGDDVAPNTEGLNEGWIATYAPGTTDLDTATPDSLTYKGASKVAGAQPIAKQEPTCTEDGHEAGFSVDGAVVAVTIPAKGHSMGEYYTTLEATCQAKGVERRDCADCDYYETRDLNIVDHSYGDYTSDNNATCTGDGTKTRKCIWCGLEDTVPDPGTMKEHSFTNYISNNDATYDADGTKTAVCDTCDATDTIPDPGSRLVREEIAQAEPLYRVVGQDGKALSCDTERKDGVLTITVEADFASLTGKLSGIRTLKAQGIDTIVFVTNGASSTFALSDLLAQSGDGYTLTHDGEKVTFTLSSGADIGKILK